MKIYDIEKIQNWFVLYIDSFRINGALPGLSEMKRVHSYRVEAVGRALVDLLKWEEDDAQLGIAACLLHDTGRFSQFRDFGTLYDGASIDHGERGYQELLQVFPRDLADEDGFSCLLQSVRWHNKKNLPDGVDGKYLPFCKLVRDADKIDVFKLVQEHIDAGRVSELLPRHAVDAPLTDAVLDEIETYGRSSYKNVKSLADFLLLQITWLLDINFAPSMKIIEQQDVVGKIISQLPLTLRARRVLDGLLWKIKNEVISNGDG